MNQQRRNEVAELAGKILWDLILNYPGRGDPFLHAEDRGLDPWDLEAAKRILVDRGLAQAAFPGSADIVASPPAVEAASLLIKRSSAP